MASWRAGSLTDVCVSCVCVLRVRVGRREERWKEEKEARGEEGKEGKEEGGEKRNEERGKEGREHNRSNCHSHNNPKKHWLERDIDEICIYYNILNFSGLCVENV